MMEIRNCKKIGGEQWREGKGRGRKMEGVLDSEIMDTVWK